MESVQKKAVRQRRYVVRLRKAGYRRLWVHPELLAKVREMTKARKTAEQTPAPDR